MPLGSPRNPSSKSACLSTFRDTRNRQISEKICQDSIGHFEACKRNPHAFGVAVRALHLDELIRQQPWPELHVFRRRRPRFALTDRSPEFSPSRSRVFALQSVYEARVFAHLLQCVPVDHHPADQKTMTWAVVDERDAEPGRDAFFPFSFGQRRPFGASKHSCAM